MASETDVVNSALALIGANLLTSIDDDTSNNATLARLWYADTRDEILRMHLWNFATKRVELAELATTPSHGWDRQYQLPSDNIRANKINESDRERLSSERRIAIEGDKLLTNSTDVFLEYIARITDVNLFDPIFRAALEHRLASKFAYAVTNNTAKGKEQFELFESRIIEARIADAHEGSPKRVTEDDLINVRGITSGEEQRPFGF